MTAIIDNPIPPCNEQEQIISRLRHVDSALWLWLRHRALAEQKVMGHLLNEILAEAKARREAAAVAARQKEENRLS